MHRLDDKLIALDEQLATEEDVTKLAEIKDEISRRENLLLPLYLQIAHEFADLHDRAGRMKAKGVITDVLSWKRSREYFYHRVQRKIAENELRKKVMKADSRLTWEKATTTMKDMVTCDWNDDRGVVEWISNSDAQMGSKIKSMKFESVASDISKKLDELSASERSDLLSRLR